ncbi:kinesin-like protein KIN-14B [Artemisia annua]|uniref:Kinesin-like protein KIN-14B n=1 Tax=Artemisia annua TaxID=35608 RepID=A0A2U1MK54_ARTAN|nr:kinesin-like protein KIN-14B [Artemisia annua]
MEQTSFYAGIELHIRSLLARSPDLQCIKVSPVERFLEKSTAGHGRSPAEVASLKDLMCSMIPPSRML